jgi:hypothetical protein
MSNIARGNDLARGTKRTRVDTCTFCQIAPASIVANLSTGGKRKVQTPLCWLHYYTSRAVRCEEVEILVAQENIQKELNESGLQDLFAEAYLELQHELATESALTFKNQKADPLSILNKFRGKPKKPPAPVRKKIDPNGGGFLRSVQIPERFRQTQQAVHNEQNQLPVVPSVRLQSSGNPYEKRKSQRTSIWKLAMEKPTDAERETTAAPSMPSCTTCSCGSMAVHVSGNVTRLNNDIKKAETWGFKDRSDEVVVRYKCGKCGKKWNGEE